MNFVVKNGDFIQADRPYFDASNRSFRYGDGLFESIRVLNGMPYNLENHFKRLSEGAKVLRIKLPLSLTLDTFKTHCKQLLDRNRIKEGGMIRFSLYRAGKGTYRPETSFAEFIIEAKALPHSMFRLNDVGLSIDVYDEIRKPINQLSVFKTSNALYYIIAAEYARENGLDDALILNEDFSIIESTSSNVFIVSNGVLYTPALEHGCVGGTFRMKLINLAVENGIKVYECSLAPQNLLAADEIFLTNAVKGIQWVVSYKTKRYFNNTAKALINMVNQDAVNSESDSLES